MKISLKWVNELIDLNQINLVQLIEKLTLGGFEVEETFTLKINNQKHIILDISSTANRTDSLSIYGISREIAALVEKPMNHSKYKLETKNWNSLIEKTTKIYKKESNCSTFLALQIQNITNQNVPNWMQEKLLSSGFVLNNNFLDFQNYIILETGYPFEFYDFQKICSKLNSNEFDLSLKKASSDDIFLASNENKYQLNDSILTLNVNQIPISIAGIINSKEFQISSSTNQILIEGSIFNAAKIRQQSRYLGLRTERSARYEKSLNITFLKEAFYRLISLLRISNPYLTCKLQTGKEIEKCFPKPILLEYSTINKILGPIQLRNKKTSGFLQFQTIENYLKRLDFKFKFNNSLLTWEVNVPNIRAEDILREIDLIEEIGRLHGFNNFVTTLPKLNRIGKYDSIYKTRKKIINCLLQSGLNELIHYSLIRKEKFLLNEIQLINPLLSDYSNLRISLLPNLIQTVSENLKQKNLQIEGFEYGHIFSYDSNKKFQETESIAGIFGGFKTKVSWSNSKTELNWFEAKGKIEQILAQLNVRTYWKPCSEKPIKKLLHPYRSAELYLDDSDSTISFGTFGQMNSVLNNQLNFSSATYLFEFNLDIIDLQLRKNEILFYQPYSLYPKIVKDLSFVIQRNIKFENIQKFLYLNGTEFLFKINVLDEYQGDSIPKDSKSLCLQLVFQSDVKTLKNQTIENIVNKLRTLLVQKFDASIRD